MQRQKIPPFCRNLLPPCSDKSASSPFLKEIGMRVFVTIAAAGSVVATGALAAVAGLFLASSAIAVAGERPSFAVKSFPISAAQVAILGGTDVREQAPSSDLTLGGMPA